MTGTLTARFDNLGYYADGPKAQRDEAVQRWERWLEGPGQRAPVE